MFHVTKRRYLISIALNGLDPNQGGTGGFSSEEGSATAKSLKANWKENSKGWVHATPEISGAGIYTLLSGNKLAEKRKGMTWRERQVNPEHLDADSAVTLEFTIPIADNPYSVDPDHPEVAVRTRRLVPPEQIFVWFLDAKGRRVRERLIDYLRRQGEPIKIIAPGFGDQSPQKEMFGLKVKSRPRRNSMPSPDIEHVDAETAFWRDLDRRIRQTRGDRLQLISILTSLTSQRRLRLRESYQEDIDLMLGYEGRVPQNIQEIVIELITGMELQ